LVTPTFELLTRLGCVAFQLCQGERRKGGVNPKLPDTTTCPEDEPKMVSGFPIGLQLAGFPLVVCVECPQRTDARCPRRSRLTPGVD